MSKSGWLVTVFTIIFLGCGPLFTLPFWLSQQFTDFKPAERLILTDQKSRLQFSRTACKAQWQKKETFFTHEDREYVWVLVYEYWESMPGEADIFYQEATYRDHRLQLLHLKTKIAFDEYPHQYSVFVTNQVYLKLPQAICDLRIPWPYP